MFFTASSLQQGYQIHPIITCCCHSVSLIGKQMRENPFKWHSIASWAAAKEPRALSSRQGTDALTHMHLRAKTPDSEITAQFLNYPLCFRFHVFFLLFLNIRLQLKKSFDDFWVLTGITSYFACFKPFSSTIFYRLISYFPISSSYPPSPSIIYTAIRPLYTVSIIHPPSPPPYFPNISSYFSFILTSYLVFFRLFYFFFHLSVPLKPPSLPLPLHLCLPRVTHMVFKWNGAH